MIRTVCTFCPKVLIEGDAPEPVSHGLCNACAIKHFGMASATCPKCGMELADPTGLGVVVAHVEPDENACGYVREGSS